ncbi:MAG: cyclase family protein [Anaerolineae bacterium]
MRIYDVSVPIRSGMVVWPGDADVVVETVRSQADGSRANVSAARLGLHTGTHVDAPCHFIAGAASVDTLGLDALIGPAWVAEVATAGPITAHDLARLGVPTGTERLLLKTPNSALWDRPEFCPDFAHLTPDAARWVVERGVRLVGVDYLSVEAFTGDGSTHEMLLAAGVVVLEGLNLSEVSSGWYTLYCLPLKVEGSDGAPARAVLVAEDR